MKHKLLVLSTFSVDDTYGGGRYVGNNLYRRLASDFSVNYVSLVESDKVKKEITIVRDFINTQIPQNSSQSDIQYEKEKQYNIELFDYIQINHWNKNTNYVNYIKKIICDFDILILEHPYFANLISDIQPKIPIIYHAHNVEFVQKNSIYENEPLNDVKQVERNACELSSQIWVASDDEKELLISEFNLQKDKVRILPHGIDLSTTKFIERKNHEKTKLNTDELSNKTTFVFTGSWHPPNLESLQFIISELAPLNENYLFFIIGSVKDNFISKYPNTKIPKNVILLGTLTNDEKNGVYLLADFAINSMFSGAGTNLKMLEFMATGLPIISTKFGSRGIIISNDTMLCDKNSFGESMIRSIKTNYKNSNSINENFSIVKQFYDYDRISKKCVNFLLELIDERIKILNSIFGNVVLELHNIGINKEDIFLDDLSKEITSITQKI